MATPVGNPPPSAYANIERTADGGFGAYPGAESRKLNADQAKFVNMGRATWERSRADWRRNSTGRRSRTYDSDFLDDFDEEEIIYCIRKYKRFPSAVPLGAMIEILTVLWEDEDELL